MNLTDTQLVAALKRRRPQDAQDLADRLHAEAELGDRQARRLLFFLKRTLTSWGAVVAEPTWEPITSPGREQDVEDLLDA